MFVCVYGMGLKHILVCLYKVICELLVWVLKGCCMQDVYVNGSVLQLKFMTREFYLTIDSISVLIYWTNNSSKLHRRKEKKGDGEQRGPAK